MPPSSDRSEAERGFRSDADMLAVVTQRAEQELVARRRSRRMVSGGIAALAVVVVGVSVFAFARDGDGSSTQVEVGGPGSELSGDGAATSTTLTREELPEGSPVEGWTPMAASPLSPRSRAVSAWTGSELLVWGGEGKTSDACMIQQDGSALCGEQVRGDGAAYDPDSDTWRPMADSPLPEDLGSQFRYRGAWTGSELVVWGGPAGEGAAYDPVADSWRRIAPAPILTRTSFGLVWTGEEVVVVGGSAQVEEPDPEDPGRGRSIVPVEVAAFSPSSGTWRLLPDLPAGRVDPEVLVVDGRIVVLGGFVPQAEVDEPPVLSLDGGRWTDLGDPLVGEVAAAAWTGEHLVVSGRVPFDPPDVTTPVVAALTPSSGVWDPWPDPVDRMGAWQLVWTGVEVVRLPDPGLGAPESDLLAQAIESEGGSGWRALPPSDLETVVDAAVAWTGSELLFWGGAIQGGYGGDPRDVGARYSPGAGR